jgi:hypothetical protein
MARSLQRLMAAAFSVVAVTACSSGHSGSMCGTGTGGLGGLGADASNTACGSTAVPNIVAFNSAACNQCGEAACRSQADACQASTACGDAGTCYTACTTSACAQACLAQNSLLLPLVQCVESSCASECGYSTANSTTGTAIISGGALNSTACSQCGEAACVSQAAACNASTACVNAMNCYDDCTTSACAQACVAQSALAPPLAQCMEVSCFSACGF